MLNSKSFKDALDFGHEGERIVAQRLRDAGLTVKLGDQSHATTAAEKLRHAGSIDMFVNGLPVEVKRYDHVFTRPGDYPFNLIIVDPVKKWDSKKEAPKFLLIISARTDAIIGIDCESKPDWIKEGFSWRPSERKREFYKAPVWLSHPFEEIISTIKRMTPSKPIRQELTDIITVGRLDGATINSGLATDGAEWFTKASIANALGVTSTAADRWNGGHLHKDPSLINKFWYDGRRRVAYSAAGLLTICDHVNIEKAKDLARWLEKYCAKERGEVLDMEEDEQPQADQPDFSASVERLRSIQCEIDVVSERLTDLNELKAKMKADLINIIGEI